MVWYDTVWCTLPARPACCHTDLVAAPIDFWGPEGEASIVAEVHAFLRRSKIYNQYRVSTQYCTAISDIVRSSIMKDPDVPEKSLSNPAGSPTPLWVERQCAALDQGHRCQCPALLPSQLPVVRQGRGRSELGGTLFMMPIIMLQTSNYLSKFISHAEVLKKLTN